MALVLMGLLLVLGGIAAFIVALALIKRWPSVGLYAVAAMAMLAWEFPSLPSLATVAGFQIKPEDLTALLLAVDLISRPSRFLALTRRYNWVMILTALCLVCAAVMGMIVFGPAKAVNEARPFFWTIVLTAWMLNQNWSSQIFQRAFRRWVVLLGLGLVGLFIYHVAVYGFGSADSFVISSGGVEQTGRPLVSGQAALLACFGFFLFMGSTTKGQGGCAALGVIFLVVAVLCQHRSVWAAVGLGVLLILVRLRGPGAARTALGAYFGGTVLAVLILMGSFDGLKQAFIHSMESTGTYSGRVDAWTILVQESFHRGPWSVLFGEPFGFGYARITGGDLITFAPHNWYVTIFLRLGLVGLFAFVALLVIGLFPLLRRREGLIPTTVVVFVTVYMWSYSLPWYLVPMLAWALAFGQSLIPEKLPLQRRLVISPAYQQLFNKVEA